MYTTLLKQYNLILGAREALFSYCEKLSTEELNRPVTEFNNSSIKSLLIHSANTYIHWIVNVGMQHQQHFFDENNIKDITTVRSVFAQVDNCVNEFLLRHKDRIDVPLKLVIPNKNIPVVLSPLQIFTHVVTHEFHHKGQILTMSRILGYTPVDTDVIRT